ncbi:unnamed protein product [Owenia fusiformis]|uniref:Pre-mRNA-splicing regulator WTAP n=1 Tax=Owenia fusiformis TaxID=6347 RepID=A0A8S4Q064_OWEFU|nr:unnamed protein product [Owenia fusiformis]
MYEMCVVNAINIFTACDNTRKTTGDSVMSGPPRRVSLGREDLHRLSKEEILEMWEKQEIYLDFLETRNPEKANESKMIDEFMALRDSEEKLRQQQIEATRRENVLVMRLTTKEREMQDYANQLSELTKAQNTSPSQLRSMLLDPAINLMFQRMKKEMDNSRDKLEQAQKDLAAWKFTPDSQTGKRLMARCRMLLQENEDLGKTIASGRIAKLEGDIALEKTLVSELKKSQAETDEFLVELDEDVEGMQSTIYFLQQQLKDTKDRIVALEAENVNLRQQQQQQSLGTTGSTHQPRPTNVSPTPTAPSPVSMGTSDSRTPMLTDPSPRSASPMLARTANGMPVVVKQELMETDEFQDELPSENNQPSGHDPFFNKV